MRLRIALSCALALAGVALPAAAGVCTVPGSHATIQAAIDDPTCDPIQLASQTYPESIFIGRSLTLSGPMAGTAILEGRMRAAGAGVAATVDRLQIQNGCERWGSLVEIGAQMVGNGLSVLRSGALPCPPNNVFADGFESGGTTSWDTVVN